MAGRGEATHPARRDETLASGPRPVATKPRDVQTHLVEAVVMRGVGCKSQFICKSQSNYDIMNADWRSYG